MKRFPVLLLLFDIFCFPSNAQLISNDEQNFLLNYQQIEYENPINYLAINQTYNNNEIVSPQNKSNSVLNCVRVNQKGTENIGYIDQFGSGLETILWQINSNNEANLWSIGEQIKVSVKQEGDGNLINSYIENAGNTLRSATLLQEGDFNKIDLALIGDGFTESFPEQKVIINQLGNYNQIKATMEPFCNPFEINQTPGVNGEGMKVAVSTAFFVFPMKN